jgi:predicted ATPase
MYPCPCSQIHAPRRVVLTGGPGAGKTAVLELIRQSFCHHVKVLPEAASIVFGGGFPRGPVPAVQRASQRAIFYVQRELEAATTGERLAVVLHDRGTIDGLAYWPGPDDFWAGVGTSLGEQLARYDAVIHLRTPSADGGYDQSNPLRIEAAEEAQRIDERIADAWRDHPRRFVVESTESFLTKARRALALLLDEMPTCCRHHQVPALAGDAPP